MFYWIVSLGNSKTGAAAGDLMKYLKNIFLIVEKLNSNEQHNY
jgi:hypothetical protein